MRFIHKYLKQIEWNKRESVCEMCGREHRGKPRSNLDKIWLSGCWRHLMDSVWEERRSPGASTTNWRTYCRNTGCIFSNFLSKFPQNSPSSQPQLANGINRVCMRAQKRFWVIRNGSKNVTRIILQVSVHIINSNSVWEHKRFACCFLAAPSPSLCRVLVCTAHTRVFAWACMFWATRVYRCRCVCGNVSAQNVGATLLWLNSFLPRTDTESPNNITVGAIVEGVEGGGRVTAVHIFTSLEENDYCNV